MLVKGKVVQKTLPKDFFNEKKRRMHRLLTPLTPRRKSTLVGGRFFN
jgi:hypothetical protein